MIAADKIAALEDKRFMLLLNALAKLNVLPVPFTVTTPDWSFRLYRKKGR